MSVLSMLFPFSNFWYELISLFMILTFYCVNMNRNIISNSVLNNFISNANLKENEFGLFLSVTERVHKTVTLRECQSHSDKL